MTFHIKDCTLYVEVLTNNLIQKEMFMFKNLREVEDLHYYIENEIEKGTFTKNVLIKVINLVFNKKLIKKGYYNKGVIDYDTVDYLCSMILLPHENKLLTDGDLNEILAYTFDKLVNKATTSYECWNIHCVFDSINASREIAGLPYNNKLKVVFSKFLSLSEGESLLDSNFSLNRYFAELNTATKLGRDLIRMVLDKLDSLYPE